MDNSHSTSPSPSATNYNVISPISRLHDLSTPTVLSTPNIQTEDLELNEELHYKVQLEDFFLKHKSAMEEKAMERAKLVQKQWMRDKRSFQSIIEEVYYLI